MENEFNGLACFTQFLDDMSFVKVLEVKSYRIFDLKLKKNYHYATD